MRTLISNPGLYGFIWVTQEGQPLSPTTKGPLLQVALSAGQTQSLFQQSRPHLRVTSHSLLLAFMGPRGMTLTGTLFIPSLTQPLKTWINGLGTMGTTGPSSPLPDVLLWL